MHLYCRTPWIFDHDHTLDGEWGKHRAGRTLWRCTRRRTRRRIRRRRDQQSAAVRILDTLEVAEFEGLVSSCDLCFIEGPR